MCLLKKARRRELGGNVERAEIKTLKEELSKQLDELELLDLLGIDTEQLLDRFDDLVLENFEELQKAITL